ncbi:MAG: arginine N-succinyltransferase [Bdellovibrionaceae bacterium]|nr:arginine N-succinyltransferase [Pseudobdellovibrionaceae bacterium]
MTFLVREVRHDDLNQLVDLARQFALLNLPADKKVIAGKIDRSVKSFAGELPKHETEYLFVVEDTEEQIVVGSSLIMAKHGTEEIPHSYFKVLERNHSSRDLGIGFIHKVLRFQWDADGPTEIGGLLVDKMYRKRPEKLGKQISLSRFLYMGMHPERFEDRILCELTPPLTEEGRSEFWEALGRRFTGLPYQEADLISQGNKEFIRTLFPEEDIYMCLLDAKARLVLGRVGEQTKPAQHLLESIGFKYLEEVDPFDGGPHFGVSFKEALPIKLGQRFVLEGGIADSYPETGLLGYVGDEGFRAGLVTFDREGDSIFLSPKSQKTVGAEAGQEVFVSPFHYPRPHKEQT